MEGSTIMRLGDIRILAIVLMVLSLCGCKPQQVLVEKVRVETRTEYVTDTVTITIPAQSVSVDTPKNESHIETDYAESNAWINDDGTLHHDIKNKPQNVDVPFEKPIEHRDSIVEKPVPYPVVEYRDKPLTSWQSFEIKGFWILTLILILIFIVKYRRPLMNIAKKILP